MSDIEIFRDAIRSAGLEPPDAIQTDGKIHRFSSNNKRGDDAGWYVYHGDGIPAGAFGDWRTDTWQSWRAEIGRELTSVEEAAHRLRIEAMRREREAEEIKRHSEAAKKAAAIWKAATEAPTDHPYLVRKSINPHGAGSHEGALVIPVRNAKGELCSLQFIDGNGEKRFLTGGRVAGCYFAIGDPKGAAALCLAEGFATGASIHEATGYPVVVSFNAGNLGLVAIALREKSPDIQLIVCADDDVDTEGNPGLTKAKAAALAVGARLAIPDFGANRPAGVSDFNDLMAFAGREAVKRVIAAAKAVNSLATGIIYQRLSDVQAMPIQWLWPDRIARGKLTMIAGNPGLGKSQLAINLAATVSTSGSWPGDGRCSEPGAVVILSSEDDAADTIRPRLEAAGADLQLCYILEAIRDVDREGKTYQRSFSLKRDLEQLSLLLTDLKDVRLVVVDPISAYLGDADSHKNAEIRALLAPLGNLAAKHSVAVVAVSHLNKGGQQDALLRVMGSLAFVAAARAAYAVVKDQDEPDRRLFLPLKNNLGSDSTGYAFTVESVTLPSGILTSRVVWESEPVTITAQEAMTPVCDAGEQSELTEARVFLESLLADGPVSAKQVRADAEGAGHSWATIRRAQKLLGVQAAKGEFKGGWQWRLPSKVLKKSEDAHTKNVSTFGENEHLRDPWD